MARRVVANKPAFRFWFAIYGFVAFIMTIAVVVFAWLASESRKEAGEGRTASAQPAKSQAISAERLQLLSQFNPPPYSSAGLREPPGFAKAMARYSAGDYAGAIPGLRAFSSTRPEFVPARFFLGICLLRTNDRKRAIEELHAVAAAPPSPYVEKARFYLAKAYLADADRSAAQQQLDVVIALQGDLEPQARILLAQIQ